MYDVELVDSHAPIVSHILHSWSSYRIPKAAYCNDTTNCEDNKGNRETHFLQRQESRLNET